MRFQYNPYIWPLFVSAAMSLSLGIYALLRRYHSKGSKSFILSMFVVTIWSFGNALEMAAADFNTKLIWANVQYFAYCYSPVTLLALCMQFTGYDKWVNNRKVLWLAFIPTIITILVWTDCLHGLIRYDMHMDYSGVFPVIAKKYGPAFYIHAAYSHILNIIGWVLVIRAVFIKNTVYRKQAIALFAGISLIVVPNILYISGLSPIKRFDVTPVFFGPAGMIIAWGIYRFKMFDLVPLARATVIESMNAGVLVMDLQNRVLDINPTFEKIIGMPASTISARRVEKVLEGIPKLAKACTDRSIAQTEFNITTEESEKIYEVFLSSLTNNKGAFLGRLAVIYDITEKKQAEHEIMKHHWKLAVIEERERIARDMHDNLGQTLGFINLQAQGIRQELVNTGVTTALDKLDKLVSVSQTAHSDIRQYIKNARNSEIIEKDFLYMLRSCISSFEEQSGLKVRLSMPDGFSGDSLDPNSRINLLNIIREALNNIRKYAEAKNVGITFEADREYLSVAVEDDGRGFDTRFGIDDNNSGFGMGIMRERASEIGAAIDISSTPGKGSRIAVTLPAKRGEHR